MPSQIQTITDMTTTMNVFMVKSFVSRKITIRWQTTAEIWAAIGGLYGGAMLVMGLLFAASGYVDKKGSEVMVFKFHSDETKQEILEQYSVKEATGDVLRAQQVAALEQAVADLQGKLADVTRLLERQAGASLPAAS